MPAFAFFVGKMRATLPLVPFWNLTSNWRQVAFFFKTCFLFKFTATPGWRRAWVRIWKKYRELHTSEKAFTQGVNITEKPPLFAKMKWYNIHGIFVRYCLLRGKNLQTLVQKLCRKTKKHQLNRKTYSFLLDCNRAVTIKEDFLKLPYWSYVENNPSCLLTNKHGLPKRKGHVKMRFHE